MTALLVDPADVEHGDLVAGRTVAEILLDCADGRTWELRDQAGAVIALVPVGGQVEVERGLPGGEAPRPAPSPGDTGRGHPSQQGSPPTGYIEPDPCNPRGIVRRHGLYLVVP